MNKWKGLLGGVCVLGILSACVMETRHQPSRILFLGNSITLAVKNPKISWPWDADMAASSPEMDYVHQTIRLLRNKGMDIEGIIGSRDCEICDGVIGEYMENIDEIATLRPRYVVVQLGENSDLVQIQSGRLTREYQALLEAILAQGDPKIFCLSNWDEESLTSPHNDAILKAIRKFKDIHFVNLTKLAKHPENYGDSTLYQNADIRWHPGDLGMQRIAENLALAIWEAK